MLPTSAEYRKTGHEAVEPRAGTAQPPKAESAPAKKQTPSEPADDAGESAAASEAGNDPKQEKREAKPRSNAESRLKEVLEDLKRAGLTPAELKTFRAKAEEHSSSKREAQAAAKAEAVPESTAKPAEAKAPTYEDAHPKPKLEDFDSIEAHTEALTDWKLDKREFERAAREAAQAQQKAISDKLTDAKARYGDDAETSIRSAAKTIAESVEVPGAVKAVLTDSPVLVDVLYTLNSKEGELQAFLDLAKTNPAAAIRKAVLLEHLVSQELGKADSDAGTAQAAQRDESGKFVSSSKPPAKRVTEAPPPPREASGRSSAPPDDVESAAKTGDFAAYRAAQNRRDLARFQGK
jgi:hypothetical protein